jgi:hypothetical protein
MEKRLMKSFDWNLYPETEVFLQNTVLEFLSHNHIAQDISQRMLTETATRFFDWIDHVVLPEKKVDLDDLNRLGYEEEIFECPDGTTAFVHPSATFFPLLLTTSSMTEVALKPESLEHFVQVIGSNSEISGSINGPYRRAVIHDTNGWCLTAVERRGYHGFLVPSEPYDNSEYEDTLEVFSIRRRVFDDDTEGLRWTISLVEEYSKPSKSQAADAFFRSERRFWQSRDVGGQVQKSNQDRLGLGWGNHDHHTFRSSRENFHLLIQLLETLGFRPRERFFAGAEAGWGAQVLEHPVCGITIFADVDITTEERDIDFAHIKMSEQDRLGTVGLWVGLHGESILSAGMHHLAALMDFKRGRESLEQRNVKTMRPFSTFPFLQQAFVESERRSIDKSRLDKLLQQKLITEEKYDSFTKRGAISSHLENIQRDQGFKGFNQESVSVIIKETDPRIQHGGTNA